MALEFTLPEIGEGVMEGEIVEWHVKIGDQVEPDQPLLSVLTDKATMEIAATFSGTIESLNGEAGDVLEVGSTLLTYGTDGASAAPAAVEEAPTNTGLAQAAEENPAGGSRYEFALPEIGEGVMEGEIVEWLVAVGDAVEPDQPIASVLTDKATMEITSPVKGVVSEIRGESGDVVEVGNVIMVFQTADGVSGSVPVADAAPAPQPTAATQTVSAPAVTASIGDVDPANNPSISAFGTPLATPAVRRFASSQGVDLARVKGSGPNHRITRKDVERALSQPTPTATSSTPATPPTAAKPKPVAVASSGEDRREKIRGLRKAIHASMTRSKDIIPHFTFVDEVEMDKLVAIRNQLKGEAQDMGTKLTYLPFIAKAVCLALRKFPIMNASVDDEAGEIIYRDAINLGIATATKNGLTVPVVKTADQKTVLQLASEMAEVTDRARNLKSTMDDITGATFTITSLGRIGGLLATPIINHPEVAIMGIHNLQERAVVRNGEIVIRKMMNISVSFDHRVIDGDVGATFAGEVKSYLEEPSRLFLHMA